MSQYTKPPMTAREGRIALAALVFSVLAIATSVDVGRNAVEAALSGLTAYGTVVLLAALALSVSVGKIWNASKAVLAVAVLLALVLFGLGKALAEVIS